MDEMTNDNLTPEAAKEQNRASEEKQKLTGDESIRVQRAAWVDKQVRLQRETEDKVRETMLEEQRLLNERNKSIEADMDRSRELKRYNDDCAEELNAQVYALHGLTQDKLQGMKEYRNAYYQGCALVLFVLSVALTAISGYLHGITAPITLIMLAAAGLEGALLSQEGKRGKLLDFLCRIMYVLIFPATLVLYICFEQNMPVYNELMSVYAIVAVAALIIGTGGYFVYNPYRGEKGRVRAAKNDLKELEQIARKAVKKNRKNRKKQEAKLSRIERREEEKFLKKKRKEEAKQAKLKKREELHQEKLKKNAEINAVKQQNRTKRIELRKQQLSDFTGGIKNAFSRDRKSDAATEKNNAASEVNEIVRDEPDTITVEPTELRELVQEDQ